MPDAIDNLAQDLNQANAVDEFPGFPGLKMGDLVPGMAGVRIGDTDFYGTDAYGQEAPYNWRTGAFEFQAAPSDVGFGNIDYNIRDQPVDRINIGNTDEQDALIRTGIGTPLDPKTEDFYGVKGLVPPHQAGGFVGVDYLTPKQIEDLTAGQTPSSHPEEFITRGKTILIPGRGAPTYRQSIDTDGNISYINSETRKVDFIVPSAPGYPGVPDLRENPNLKLPFISTKTTDTSVGSTPFTPSPVGAYQPVGAAQPPTASVGGFDNTGGNVTAGPGVAGPGGTTDVTPGYVPKPEVKPGDEFKDSPWTIASSNPPRKLIVTPEGVTEGTVVPGTGGIKVGDVYPDGEGNIWDWENGKWIPFVKTPPINVTTPVVTTPPGGGTTTTPPGGGTTTTPPGGGARPGTGTGTGTGTYTGTPLPTREPVTPLVRREVVIPTKGTKEVPLPDRQADPFAKLYADLLANSQQQQDQYRYINYDPDQIMNAAMSGFRRRGAMRSLQG